MGEEKYGKLTDAELEMMSETVVEPTKEDVESTKYSADQQKVIDAFEAMSAKDENYKKIVDGLKERGIFEGKGDAYEQILKAVKNLEERGVAAEEIDEALNKQVSKMVERMSDLRAAA